MKQRSQASAGLSNGWITNTINHLGESAVMHKDKIMLQYQRISISVLFTLLKFLVLINVKLDVNAWTKIDIIPPLCPRFSL